MTENPSPAPGAKKRGARRPHAGWAPALGLLGLACFGFVFYVARVAHTPDRPYVTIFLGLSVQLLSTAVFIALCRRWLPVYLEFGKTAPVPYHIHVSLYGWSLFLWLSATFYWLTADKRPRIASALLLACAALPLIQTALLLVADHSFRKHALLLLTARRLPPDLPDQAFGFVTGSIDADPRMAVLNRITWYIITMLPMGTYISSPNTSPPAPQYEVDAAVTESREPRLTIQTPGGPLDIDTNGCLWSTFDRSFEPPENNNTELITREQVRGAEPVIAVGTVVRESPQARPKLTRNLRQRLLIFGAPAGSDPRSFLRKLYAWSLLRVVGMIACAGLGVGAAWWNPMVDRYDGIVRVTSTQGIMGLRAGDTCTLRLLAYISRDRVRRCQPALTCAGRVFYASNPYSFFDCQTTRDEMPIVNGADKDPTWSDKDPAFSIQSGPETSTVHFWDNDGPGSDATLEVRGTLVDLHEF